MKVARRVTLPDRSRSLGGSRIEFEGGPVRARSGA